MISCESEEFGDCPYYETCLFKIWHYNTIACNMYQYVNGNIPFNAIMIEQEVDGDVIKRKISTALPEPSKRRYKKPRNGATRT